MSPPASQNVRNVTDFSLFSFYRTTPRQISTSPTQIFLRSTLVIFYYSTRFLGLHSVWVSAYRSIPARPSYLEDAANSRRSCWTGTLQKMNRVWTLVIMISSLVITWALTGHRTQLALIFRVRLSVAFLQIDDILNNIYPRTFAILAFILSSGSLAAGCIFVVNREGLECVEKFRKWETASQNPKKLASVDFWACLALPLTSLAWYVLVFSSCTPAVKIFI